MSEQSPVEHLSLAGFDDAKVDVDAEPELADRFQIRSIPTLMVFRDGRPVAAQAGAIAAEQLVAAVDRIASAPSVDATEQAA
jgi:thioredoxin 1